MHENGFLHLDIKPENILTKFKILKTREMQIKFVKRRNLSNSIYLIDFDNVEKYKLPNGKIRPQTILDEFKGTPDYMSIRGLEFKTQGRCDDF